MLMDYMRGTVKDIFALFIIFIFVLSTLKVAAISRFLGSKVMSSLGVASYSLYLLHQNIALSLISAGHAWIENNYMWPIYILFVYAVVVLLSLAIYHLYESPLNRYIVNSLRK
jgi:peptidoglycan/LPS O-acetylase OafA/YrhL